MLVNNFIRLYADEPQEILTDAVRMEPTQFRERLTRFLKSNGFEL